MLEGNSAICCRVREREASVCAFVSAKKKYIVSVFFFHLKDKQQNIQKRVKTERERERENRNEEGRGGGERESKKQTGQPKA